MLFCGLPGTNKALATAWPPCRDEQEWIERVAAALEVPRAMRERQGAFLGLDGLPPGMATDLIGMGTWRLRSEWHGDWGPGRQGSTGVPPPAAGRRAACLLCRCGLPKG